jgi:group II intron reverse transcriptase/maturase
MGTLEMRTPDCRKARNRKAESEMDSVRKLQRTLYKLAKQDRKRRFHSLYDKIHRRDVLWEAWKQVKSNWGSAGVDGETIEEIISSGKEREMTHLLEQELRERRYRFSAVREVEIPKASGGTRPLGIATVRDRVVQTAMKIVLEPIFEADFHECSYGYRPKRGAWMATQNIRNDLYQPKAWGVVEIDLKSYFTSITHWKLMRLIIKRVSDGSMLKLIRQTLKVPVSRQGRLHKVRKGVPQGSPISPLYSNVYLNVVDQLWHTKNYPEKLGASLHRYADDMVIVCRRNAKHPLGALVALAKKLDVEVSQEKTRITEIKDGFDFIGFEFVKRRSPTHGRSVIYLFPSKDSQKEIRSRIRKETHRKAPLLPKDLLEKVNRLVRGWAEYYRYTNGSLVLRRLQRFTNHRVRRYLHYRRKGRGSGYDNYPEEKLYRMGLIQIHSGWVKPGGPIVHATR